MAYSNILNLSKQIDGLYAACIRTAFAEALTAEYGAGAFAEFVRMDRENTASLAAAGTNVPCVLQGKHSFEDMDVQACSKALLYLEKARDVVFDRFDVTKTNPRVFQAVRPVLFQLIEARNYKAHTEGVLDHDRLKLCAKQETVVVEQLFPRRVDIIDAEGRTYLARMELLLVQMLGEISVKRYRAEDYLDPRRFDLTVFHDVCAALRIRSVTESGEKYFYSSNLATDLEVLKNQLPKPKTASAFAAAPGIGKGGQQAQQSMKQTVKQPGGQQTSRQYAPEQTPLQPFMGQPSTQRQSAQQTAESREAAQQQAVNQLPRTAAAYPYPQPRHTQTVSAQPGTAVAPTAAAPAREVEPDSGREVRENRGQLLAAILLAVLVLTLALVLILVMNSRSENESSDDGNASGASGPVVILAENPVTAPWDEFILSKDTDR